jgi:hypothetical protein
VQYQRSFNRRGRQRSSGFGPCPGQLAKMDKDS